MSRFSFIKKFFSSEKRTQDRRTKDVIASVKQAAQASNYNQASIQAFYALEEIGRTHGNIDREISVTAREYGKVLADNGNVTTEELEPIIYNFEIAKYSPDEVTFEDYRTVEETLESVVKKYRTPTVRAKTTAQKARKKRRRPSKRATGAGTRRRRRKSE